jgi:hypothetical protein
MKENNAHILEQALRIVSCMSVLRHFPPKASGIYASLRPANPGFPDRVPDFDPASAEVTMLSEAPQVVGAGV